MVAIIIFLQVGNSLVDAPLVGFCHIGYLRHTAGKSLIACYAAYRSILRVEANVAKIIENGEQ